MTKVSVLTREQALSLFTGKFLEEGDILDVVYTSPLRNGVTVKNELVIDVSQLPYHFATITQTEKGIEERDYTLNGKEIKSHIREAELSDRERYTSQLKEAKIWREL